MKSRHPHFTSPNAEIEARIDSLLSQLTLEEKILMLGGQREPKQGGDTYGVERLGIPPLKMADASVGVHWWTDRSTTYPATIALAATWDAELAYRTGAAVGRDARARGVHILLGPGVNIYRSPLCGRNFEYLGEDPCLAAQTVTAYIRGLQDQGVSATVKHYAANYQEWDRHNVSSDLDERTLREVYLPAFRAAVEEAGSGALMTAYNLVNSVHASEHAWLLLDVLKGEWGFQGLAMSDWVSVYSAVGAANGGLDLEMPTAKWMDEEHLVPAVRDGLVPEAVIDDKVRRLLRLMICFGWSDHPQQDKSIPIEDPETAAASLEVARRGCVLLKNEDAFLPLDPGSIGTLAVIGPHARSTPVGGGGSAFNKPWRTIDILEGLKAVFGAERVKYRAGVLPDSGAAAFANSRWFTPDGEPGLKAEYFNSADCSGEPVLTRVEPRLENRWASNEIADGVDRTCFSIRWTGTVRPEHTGTHVFYQTAAAPFRVRLADEVIFDIMDGADLKEPRVMRTLEAGREYAVEVVYQGSGAFNSICLGWQLREMEEEREAALALAREADAVVFCGGHSDTSEGEGFDRAFGIGEEQEALLLALAEANPRLVAVITAGGNVDMRPWIDRVKALLYAWYPGQEGGTAVAEILAGRVNPSGKLPATFERALEDRSSFDCYHDADGDKRVTLTDGVFTGYRHHDRTGVAPQFAFGHGLSYTTFAYENLQVPAEWPAEGALSVRFDLVNTGKIAGTEVAQLYLSDAEASVPRPAKELKAYAAVALEPGERKTVELTLAERDLQFFSMECGKWVAEPGEFAVHVAASAADVRLRGRFVFGT